jgi:hypothetical protein
MCASLFPLFLCSGLDGLILSYFLVVIETTGDIETLKGMKRHDSFGTVTAFPVLDIIQL